MHPNPKQQCVAGLPSPRGSAGKEWTVLDAAPYGPGAAAADPAPTWGQVLGNLKSWGITPSTPSAAVSPSPVISPQGTGPFASRDSLHLSDSESELGEGAARARSDSEGLRIPLARRGSLRRGRAGLGSDASQQQDRLRSSLDSTQVLPHHVTACFMVILYAVSICFV